ncbi:MAG: hypothetical protein IT384_20905 [Deltaproteobacteria bacterium]|nr:hypothetical protein [Deltaproteobacteria bacterium]
MLIIQRQDQAHGSQLFESPGAPVQGQGPAQLVDLVSKLPGPPVQIPGCKPEPEPGRTQVPCVDEALILDQQKIYSRTDTYTRCDPLIVRGSAPEGTKIRVYNPDMKGWPLVAEAVAGPDERWEARCEDPAFFSRGDRVKVSGHLPGQLESEMVMKATHTVTETQRVHEHYHNGQLRSRSDRIDLTAHELHADDRPPYFDDAQIQKVVRPDPNGGVELIVTGLEKSVPPGTKLHVFANGRSRQLDADDDGRFVLPLSGLSSGSVLDLRLTDVHGRVTDVALVVPSLSVDMRALASAAKWGGSPSAPLLELSTLPVAKPGSELLVRSAKSGAIEVLTADEHGAFAGTFAGVTPFEVLQFATKVDGKITDRVQEAVVLPLAAGAPLLPLDAVVAQPPSLEAALNAARASEVGGQGVIELPSIHGLPPFGTVEIHRGSELAYALRADAGGCIPAVGLAGMVAGEEFDLITKDAGGRRLGFDVLGWVAPDVGAPKCAAVQRRRAENATLAELVCSIGSGRILPEPSMRSAEVSTRLNPFDDRKGAGVRIGEIPGRFELLGRAGLFFPEAATAGRYDTMRVAVADWTTGERNIIFDHYSNQKSQRASLQVPLPVAGQPLTTQGKEALPDAKAVQAMLVRAASFVALARSNGAGPGDGAYEAALGVVHTLLYALDRIAVRGGDAQALRADAAQAVAPIAGDPVDAHRWVPAPGSTPVTTKADLAELTPWKPIQREDLFGAMLFVSRSRIAS